MLFEARKAEPYKHPPDFFEFCYWDAPKKLNQIHI